MKTWKEYYLECKDIYNKETKLDNSSINVYDLNEALIGTYKNIQSHKEELYKNGLTDNFD